MKSDQTRPGPDEVEHLLLNARLRDELEPYLDEAVMSVNTAEVPTPVENEFLASMLAWERAPVMPICKWFTPELSLPAPDKLDELDLHQTLWDTIHKLAEKRIVLDFTEHLSDRELYRLIYRDILPSLEKFIDDPNNFLHWDCADVGNNPETWLRYYASDEERTEWAEGMLDGPLPPHEDPPYPRRLPQRPL
jgi:hypothetical protein